MVTTLRLGHGGDPRVGVLHGNPEASLPDHFEIIEPVADRSRLGGVNAVLGAQGLDRGPFVYLPTEGLEEVGFAPDGLLGGQGRPVLHRHKLAKRAFHGRHNGSEGVAERNGPDSHGVLGGAMLLKGREAAVLHGKMVKPPLGSGVEGLVADHEVVDARRGVILQEVSKVSVLGEDLGDSVYEL